MSKNKYDIDELVMVVGRVREIHHDSDGKIYYKVVFKGELEERYNVVNAEERDLHTWAGLTEVSA